MSRSPWPARWSTGLLGLYAAALCAGSTSATAQPPPSFVVVVDPGHDPKRGGATSARGVAEVVFNDRAASALVKALKERSGFEVHLSREGQQRLGLGRRAARINKLEPDLVISLHHDSVQAQLLSTWELQGRKQRYNDQIAGFSLFAPTKGHHAQLAQLFAAELADRMLAAGQAPSDYHARDLKGERRDWIDESRGMYAGDFLFLLRRVEAPIVLVELGYIVNRDQERDLADPGKVEATAQLMAEAVTAFRERLQAGRVQPESGPPR